MQRMESSGAIITTSESILFQLMEDAKYSNFKAISGLVKDCLDTTATTMNLLGSKI